MMRGELMERKNASLIIVVFLSIYTVLSFLPITFLRYFAEPSIYAPGAYVIKEGWDTSINFYAYNVRVITIISLIICVIGIVALSLIYSGKESKLTKYGTYAPIVLTVLFFVICIFELNQISINGTVSGAYPKGDRGYYGTKLLWGFYVEFALLIASSVLSFLIATNRLNNNKGKIDTNETVAVQTADHRSNIETEFTGGGKEKTKK